jgi:hypothetical protein
VLLTRKHFSATILIAAFVGIVAPNVARAQLILAPNGNPTGPASATSPLQPDGYYYTVNLAPGFADTAMPLPNTPFGQPNITLVDIFNNALAAQGSAWSVTGNFGLEGNLRLDDYHAWVQTRPAVNQGTLPYQPPVAMNGAGGASLGLHYLPQGGDPVSPHWLQLIHTNVPAKGAATWTHPYDAPGWV